MGELFFSFWGQLGAWYGEWDREFALACGISKIAMAKHLGGFVGSVMHFSQKTLKFEHLSY